jgi:hypothetical protein
MEIPEGFEFLHPEVNRKNVLYFGTMLSMG